MNDVIKDLGYLTMGSRLKRLGERMQADLSRLVRAEGYDVQAGFLPALGILADHGPTTVGDLAAALGIAQPGVTRMLGQLKKQKLVSMDRARNDQRQRVVSLSKSGLTIIEANRDDLWPRIEKAVANICKDVDGPFIEQLAAIEDALDKKPLDQRAARDKQ